MLKGALLADDFKKRPAAFYRSPSGAEPVRDWLRQLDQADRHVIGLK
jgi:hypothetical protein